MLNGRLNLQIAQSSLDRTEAEIKSGADKKTETKKPEEPKKPDDGAIKFYLCPVCTVENEIAVEKCKVCSAPNPNLKTPGAPEKTVYNCPVCTVENPVTAARC